MEQELEGGEGGTGTTTASCALLYGGGGGGTSSASLFEAFSSVTLVSVLFPEFVASQNSSRVGS